ncbi:nitroreductase family protein [soil metagenome]
MTFPAPPSVHLRPIEQILDLARWAPSGDNTQPWRFEIVDDLHVVVHGFDTRDHCVYDLDGHPSQISIGALIETAAIAASAHGLGMDCRRREHSVDDKPTLDLRFSPDSSIRPSDLLAAITTRSVQRRPLRTRPLSADEKAALQASLAPTHGVLWLEGFDAKLRTALLMFRSAKLRLTMPEAYRVHRDVIEWNAQFSADRVPDQALGVDGATTRLMKFVMASWERVEFFNTFLAGTWIPRIQMDFLPALACAGHFVIHAPKPPSTIDDYVSAGRALQRFWLTATKLGLQLQPELTPLIFARYARQHVQFSSTRGMSERAEDVADRLCSLIGMEIAGRAAFVGRLGAGKAASARSLRLDALALRFDAAGGLLRKR